MEAGVRGTFYQSLFFLKRYLNHVCSVGPVMLEISPRYIGELANGTWATSGGFGEGQVRVVILK